MNPLAFVLELLTRLPPVISATQRLIEADKRIEPTPPIMTGDALHYMSGRVDGQYDVRAQQKRDDQIAQLNRTLDSPEQPEQPDPELELESAETDLESAETDPKTPP